MLLKTVVILKVGLRSFCKKYNPYIMKYLNVAEKNDAAKNIAAILSRGASNRREGLSPYNKIYEFDATVFGQHSRMVMTSVSGHLLNYEFSTQFRNWQSCNPLVLFDAPVIKTCPKDFEKIKKTLEREIRSCNGLIIWTDCDREGENIGFEVIKVCTDVKPNIRIYRAKFSEITAASVFRALSTLGQPNKNISDAVDVRQELDLRTGAAFTRLQTLRLQKVFPQKLADKLISYGSCQFPTLGFVVERYQAIEDFIPEPFWKIKMSHTVKELTTDFLWKRDRLFDKNACEAILDVCKENPQATVESVESKPKNKWRPLPLDTIEMEKNVSKKLKINAKEAMKIAEKLYTQGFISYPRTETNIFPKELNLANLVEFQKDDPRWGTFAHRIMNEGGPNPRQGKKSDQAHPPIHPTKYTNTLTGNEQRLYEYIVRHFLACVHKDAEGFETVVNVDIAGEKFTAKGLIILERNYLDVYIYEKWNAKEINNYAQGDTFMPTVLDMIESKTSAPKLLTEAELIALMDKHGIGTDATHAEHIDTIKSREYVGLHENVYFVPGTLGMGLVEGYNNIGLQVSLAKPTLRAEFENDLKLICDGLKDAEVVRQEQIQKYKAVFQTVVDKIRQIDESLANRLEDQPQEVQTEQFSNQGDYKPALKCPKCGNDMIVRNKKNGPGKYISCVGFPACKNAIWLPGIVDQIDVLDESCPRCGPDVKKLKMKFRANPFPGEPNPNIICIGGCDTMVLQTLDINVSSVRRPNQTSAPPTSSTSNNRTQSTLTNWANPNNTTARIGSNTSFNSNNGPSNTNSTFSNRNNPGNSNNKWGSSQTTAAPNTTWNSGSASSNSFSNRNNGWSSRDASDGASWNNTSTSLSTMPGHSQTNRNSFGNSSFGDATGNQDNHIVCSCNNEAVLLTVRKDGSNQGRQFYKCQSGACDFFLWAPDENAPSNTGPGASSRPNGEIRCKCGVAAVQRTVSKAGPNTGRTFYACHKPMGQGCGFFKWADEVDGNQNDDDFGGGGGGGPWGGGGGGGNSFGNTSNWNSKTNSSWKGKSKTKTDKRSAPYKNQTRGKRKCGICGEEGHIRSKCPNK